MMSITSGANEMQWYTVQTHSTFEEAVATQIRQRKEKEPGGRYIGDVISRPGRDGGFPGYLFVQMKMCPEGWQFIRSIPKVSGFVGGRNHEEIQAVPERQIAQIIEENEAKQNIAEGQEGVSLTIDFRVGDAVRVKDGAFGKCEGVVRDISEMKDDDGKTTEIKVSVAVVIFSREMEITLNSKQVELIK